MKKPVDPRSSLPSSVQLLWGVRDAARRGPKPSRSRDEIVEAAMDIADAEGLAAVSMARVAERVGVSTMALYRYVASKDELLLLMSDAGLGSPPRLPRRRGWRPRIEQWARAVRGVWLSRPWLLQIPVNGPPAGPNNVAWFDAGLGAFAATALLPEARVGIVLLVSTYIRGDVWLSVDLAAASATDPESLAFTYGEPFASLLDEQRFPELTSMIAAGVFEEGGGDDNPVDDHFEFGLGILLDGMARRIERASNG